LLAGFCIFFNSTLNSMKELILSDHFVVGRRSVDTTCDEAEHLLDSGMLPWDKYDYPALMERVAAEINTHPGTRAELFDIELNLLFPPPTPVIEDDGSPRVCEVCGGGHDFCKLCTELARKESVGGHASLRQIILRSSKGTVEYPGERHGNATPDAQYVYYRWFPSSPSAEPRYLLVVSASRSHVDNRAYRLLTGGIISLILITFALVAASIIYLHTSVYQRQTPHSATRGFYPWGKRPPEEGTE
jgi:hypothetical protein